MGEQITLLERDWRDPIQVHMGSPEPEYNTQDMDQQPRMDNINEKQLNQRDQIMQLLIDMDSVPSSLFPKIGITQYNARIKEINHDLASAKRADGSYEQIESFYMEGQWHKRLELITDDVRRTVSG